MKGQGPTLPDPDRFLSMEDGPEIELRVKGSRFVGQAFRADDEATAMARVETLRRRYHDATHHCWAVRLTPGPLERWNDDGEPSGSAGIPILGSLRRERLCNAMIVVTRYFGGTKLGVGGLVRAYGEAAQKACGVASRRAVWSVTTLEVTFPYEQLGAVEATLARSGESVHGLRREFTPAPKFLVEVPRSRWESLAASLTEATAGRVAVRRI